MVILKGKSVGCSTNLFAISGKIMFVVHLLRWHLKGDVKALFFMPVFWIEVGNRVLQSELYLYRVIHSDDIPIRSI